MKGEKDCLDTPGLNKNKYLECDVWGGMRGGGIPVVQMMMIIIHTFDPVYFSAHFTKELIYPLTSAMSYFNWLIHLRTSKHPIQF